MSHAHKQLCSCGPCQVISIPSDSTLHELSLYEGKKLKRGNKRWHTVMGWRDGEGEEWGSTAA